jgi:hypothetical protein
VDLFAAAQRGGDDIGRREYVVHYVSDGKCGAKFKKKLAREGGIEILNIEPGPSALCGVRVFSA